MSLEGSFGVAHRRNNDGGIIRQPAWYKTGVVRCFIYQVDLVQQTVKC